MDALPLRHPTPRSWSEAVRGNVPLFLSDHAACEQQAALSALALSAQYPADDELVDRMAALAAEEIQHFRRVLALLRRRRLSLPRRRPNPWVRELRRGIDGTREPQLKLDRLLAAAIIEARSCERFACARAAVDDAAVAGLLEELGAAEDRHWRLFVDLARRDVPAARLEHRLRYWMDREADVSRPFGVTATVHG